MSPKPSYEELEHRVRELEQQSTELQRSQQALRRSEMLFRDLVENANDAIFVTQDGMIKFANPSALKMTGYTAKELASVPFVDMIHLEDRQKIIDRHFRRLRGEDVVANYTFRVRSKTGQELWQQINSVLISWEDRPATLSFIRDITQEKRLERRLIQSQKMEAIGTLAGGIANDFNNLMTTIQGNVSLMLFDFPSSHPNHQNLINIEKQIERGTRLTSQLLGYAKIGKYQIRAIDLNEIVEETSETFGRTKKEISILRQLAEDLWPIEADQGQIEQTLLNLYVNAADAMPRGGKLILKTMNVTRNAISGKLFEPRQGRYVSLSVSDSGEGIDPEIQEHLFDPFFTTKGIGAGSGLGLASVYSIIKSHGGYIEVDSEKERGTTFYVILPAIEHKPLPPVEASGEIVEGHGTILLVDDEEMVLKVGVQLLEKLGYEVIKADSGQQAVKLFTEHEDRIDLVIVDIIMPEMGGGEVFDRIRQLNADINVLLSSGYSIDGQAQEILNRGGNGFIQKPFTLEQLSQKIKETLPVAGNKARN